MKQTCEQFCDYHIDTFIEMSVEQFYERAVSTDKMLEVMIDIAKETGVELTDLSDWDYDKYFYQCYKMTEKC